MVMATNANLPDFHTAFLNTLMETRQSESLLAHPEFRDRLMRICRRLAKPDDVADLFDEVCLKILNQVATGLPPFRTEPQFFGWVAGLAKKVYMDQKRHRLETMACTESHKHWPKSSAAVPEDLFDKYMDHVEKCPYHAELIFQEQEECEQKLRSIFRLARGLDSQGRLLQGEHLDAALADHERRLAAWKKEARIENSPFNHIALYNGDRQIASCGRFLDFSRHESINELDPQAALQIRGIGNIENQDVLLGVYALAGVRHEGLEQLLALDNGFTVGLRVVRLSENTFAVDFRCVETETLGECSPERDRSNADKLRHRLDDVGILPKASAIKSLQFRLLRCAAGIKQTNQSWTSSVVKALARPSHAVQLGVILVVTGLVFQNGMYLHEWTRKITQQITSTCFHCVINKLYSQKTEVIYAATRSVPEPQRPVLRAASNPESNMASPVKPIVMVARIEANNSALKNERQVAFVENAAPKKLIKYTSRVGWGSAAPLLSRSEMATLLGTPKSAQTRNFRGISSAPDSFNSRKLSGNCPGKDQK
jgi:DNA-directed RNA polymerase specialized sigma24 family protein